MMKIIRFKSKDDYNKALAFFKREAGLTEAVGPRVGVVFSPIVRVKLTGRYVPRLGCLDYYGEEVKITGSYLN